jgi:hypothetical protein
MFIYLRMFANLCLPFELQRWTLNGHLNQHIFAKLRSTLCGKINWRYCDIYVNYVCTSAVLDYDGSSSIATLDHQKLPSVIHCLRLAIELLIQCAPTDSFRVGEDVSTWACVILSRKVQSWLKTTLISHKSFSLLLLSEEHICVKLVCELLLELSQFVFSAW